MHNIKSRTRGWKSRAEETRDNWTGSSVSAFVPAHDKISAILPDVEKGSQHQRFCIDFLNTTCCAMAQKSSIIFIAVSMLLASVYALASKVRCKRDTKGSAGSRKEKLLGFCKSHFFTKNDLSAALALLQQAPALLPTVRVQL